MERRALAERNACRTACDRDAEPGGNRSRTRQDTCSEYSGTFDSTQEPDALAAHVRICAGGLIQRVEIPLWISSLRRRAPGKAGKRLEVKVLCPERRSEQPEPRVMGWTVREGSD